MASTVSLLARQQEMRLSRRTPQLQSRRRVVLSSHQGRPAHPHSQQRPTGQCPIQCKNLSKVKSLFVLTIPPCDAWQVTQLGHVKDLATAFVKVLDNEKASRQVYNISGERFVTFDGIAKACAAAAGAPEPELVHYNPKDFDFGGKKAFPLRDQHFFTSIAKVCRACFSLLMKPRMIASSCPLTSILCLDCAGSGRPELDPRVRLGGGVERQLREGFRKGNIQESCGFQHG